MLSYFVNKLDAFAEEVEGNLKVASASGLLNAKSSTSRSIVRIDNENRLVICGYLGDKTKVKIPACNRSLLPLSPDEVLQWLSKHAPQTENKDEHNNNEYSYVVFNMSGEKYNYDILQDQVVEYTFPGLPAPPFNRLCEIVDAVKGWLESESHNVAILHDISGRRSAVVAVCTLLSLEAEKLENTKDVDISEELKRRKEMILMDVVDRLGSPGAALVPSQLRYIDYYTRHLILSMLGVNEQRLNMVLQRVIVNGVPDFVNSISQADTKCLKPVQCKPFLKILQNSKIIGGTFPDSTYRDQDSCFSLVPRSPYPNGPKHQTDINAKDVVELQDDVLLRVYHFPENNQPIIMFSVTFNVNFVEGNVLRLKASEVDGANCNARFPKSFFLDLIFGTKEQSYGRGETVPSPGHTQTGKVLDRQNNVSENMPNRNNKTDISGKVHSVESYLLKEYAFENREETEDEKDNTVNENEIDQVKETLDEIDMYLNENEDGDDLELFKELAEFEEALNLGDNGCSAEKTIDLDEFADKYLDFDDFASSLG
mmetsp:Transcript_1538/g.1983  ORF Transcript_1538/g.1983 Transcript_1538/m.1983 type:complete len:540 (+) Transcript_1538:188-1807(+)|eukprot:CAMPEP_0204826470 /NCGR_PEP_ID=MMETSP1346-20131115/4152_1 /ASSEMBLY_ACC=CAM_ASM_000771 /TAXON_ID=215587 /ORGANISM="Aplanochytrium stocchinoi, Strain GSBS06" /LENGTH=539 /DNA_ID=CAMNT_0051954511 /DNA_START=351 /DNA_END=1970 /DNA_ORIENTATION=-